MITRSKTQTQKFAVKLAKTILLRPSKRVGATIIALHGDLGAGKTTFTQGFIKALGVKHHITSPTFVIFRKYPISYKLKVKSKKEFKTSKSYKLKAKSYANVYHFDLYRIHRPKEILALDFKEIISNPENIVLIEWPERITKLLPKNTTWIYFSHGKKINERKIILSSLKD